MGVGQNQINIAVPKDHHHCCCTHTFTFTYQPTRQDIWKTLFLVRCKKTCQLPLRYHQLCSLISNCQLKLQSEHRVYPGSKDIRLNFFLCIHTHCVIRLNACGEKLFTFGEKHSLSLLKSKSLSVCVEFDQSRL